MANHDRYYAYFGSYAPKDGPGIYVYELDIEHARFSFVQSISGIENPSFLTIDAGKRRLYSTSEVLKYQGQAGGAVAAYAIEPESGKLTLLNERATTGEDSCHLSVDQTSSSLLVANYTGGSISVFALQEDGSIGELTQVILHQGKGVNPARQGGPHPHSVFLSPDETHVFVPDLGLDAVFGYALDARGHTLTLDQTTTQHPGGGPRHLVFHPSEQYVYVINELDSTITAYRYTRGQAGLEPLQTISTLPETFSGVSTCADIHVTQSGKFLYGSNRGHDSIAVFSIDEASGKLTSVEYASTLGKTPRNFALAPNDRFLFAANQDSDTVFSFAIDQETGRLTPLETPLTFSHPVCIKLVSRAALQ